MANKFHKNLIEADNHAITGAVTYDDIAARDGATTFNTDASNINKVVRVNTPLAFYILTSIGPPVWESIGSSLNDSFLELIDTPSTYTSQGDKVVQVNFDENALVFGQNLTAAGLPTFGNVNILNTLPANVVLTVTGAASQTASLLQIKDDGAVVRLSVAFDGQTFIDGGLDIETRDDGTIGLVVEAGAATQTADLFRVVNFAQDELFKIGQDGAVILQVDNDATIGLIIKANSGTQSGDLFQVLRADDFSLFNIEDDGRAIFSNSTNSTTAFQILGVTGEQIVLSADTVNKRVGFVTTSPIRTIHVQGDALVRAAINATSIFTVEDAAGVPVFNVRTTFPPGASVEGNFNVTGTFGDSSNNVGTLGQILSSTLTGTDWIDNDTGNVSSTGGPANNQLAIWTDAFTIKGDPDLTFNGTSLTVNGNAVITNTGAGTVAFTLDGASGQTADVLQVRTDLGAIFFAIEPEGRVVLGSEAGLTDLTIFQTVNTNEAQGLTLSGNDAVGNDEPAEGVSLVAGRLTGNNELWIMNKVDQGDGLKNSFKLITGLDVPLMAGTDNGGTLNRNLTFGINALGGGMGVGFATSILQTAIKSKLHVSTGVAAEIGFIVQGVASQTADLFQARDSADAVLVAIEFDGKTKIGDSAAGLTDLTIFQSGGTETSGITYSGKHPGQATAVNDDGIVTYVGNNDPGNMQWWLAQQSDLGSPAAAAFRYTVGIPLPNVGAVTINGAANLHLSLGNPFSNVAVGFPVIASVQADVDSKIHIKTGALANLGLIVQGETNQTGDLFQARNVSDINLFSLDSLGRVNNLSFGRLATAVTTNSGIEVVIGVTDTSAARTITLQTVGILQGRTYIIKDESGAASGFNITIATQGSETIDGLSTVVISTDYGVLRLYSNGTNLFTW